jgi:lipopolysaccharide biosynthesis protein
VAQAELAKEYGISGFMYYHYWFSGRRILERPFNEVLGSGSPDFPFCLCWANENWTRTWDGRDKDVLLAQHYKPNDDVQHIRDIATALIDPRYMRVNNKPLFAVYRATSIPDVKKTTDAWREEAYRLGIGELYLCRVESFQSEQSDPTSLGFDASIEFAPDWNCIGPLLGRSRIDRWMYKLDRNRRYAMFNRVMEYDTLANNMLCKPTVDYRRYRCVTPMWDNCARRSHDAFTLIGSTPKKYEAWLTSIVADALATQKEPLVFVNAWNEWAEGNHLEPCQRFGRAYLEATKRATGTATTLEQ